MCGNYSRAETIWGNTVIENFYCHLSFQKRYIEYQNQVLCSKYEFQYPIYSPSEFSFFMIFDKNSLKWKSSSCAIFAPSCYCFVRANVKIFDCLHDKRISGWLFLKSSRWCLKKITNNLFVTSTKRILQFSYSRA